MSMDKTTARTPEYEDRQLIASKKPQ